MQRTHLALDRAMGEITSLAWSPDGLRLASAGVGGPWLHDCSLPGSPPKHLDGRWGQWITMAWSPDGRLLAAPYDGGTRHPAGLTVWDVATGAPAWEVSSVGFVPQAAAFDPSGALLAVGSATEGDDASGTGQLALYVAGGGPLLVSAEAGWATRLCFSADGTQMAYAGVARDRSVWLWDVVGQRKRATLEPPGRVVDPQTVALGFTAGAAEVRAMTAEGEALAWDLTHFAVRKLVRATTDDPLPMASPGILGAAFSGDATLLAHAPPQVREADATGDAARLWSLDRIPRLTLLPGHTGLIASMAFSPAGDRLAVADAAGIHLWDVD